MIAGLGLNIWILVGFFWFWNYSIMHKCLEEILWTFQRPSTNHQLPEWDMKWKVSSFYVDHKDIKSIKETCYHSSRSKCFIRCQSKEREVIHKKVWRCCQCLSFLWRKPTESLTLNLDRRTLTRNRFLAPFIHCKRTPRFHSHQAKMAAKARIL